MSAEQSAEGAKVAHRGLGRDLSVVPREHSETLHTSAPAPKSRRLWALHRLSLGIRHRLHVAVAISRGGSSSCRSSPEKV